jgi:hypothetical protein
MMFLFVGLVTFAVTFLLLRRTGGFLRHLIAVVLAATVMPLLGFLSFQLLHPYGGKPSYTSPQVWQAQQYATLATGAAIVLCLVIGMLAAMLVRRRNLVAASTS